MKPNATKTPAVEDCVNGMNRLRAMTASEDTLQSDVPMEDTAVAELATLLTAVKLRDDWSDDDFDTIFVEDRDPVSIGFEVARLICRSGSISGLPMVVQFFRWLVDEGDQEWLFAEGPETISSGSSDLAVAWIEVASDAANSDEEVTSVIIDGLVTLAENHPTVAPSIRTHVVKALKDSRQSSVRKTTDLMRLAVDLKFDEAAEAIENAFSEDRIDCGWMGDWETVRKELHVEGKGLPMPEKPHNSMDDFRRNVGVGAFSKSPIFLSGEIQEDAVYEYLSTACDAFSRSEEGQQILDDGEEPFYVRQFLELGVTYLGVTTETITVADVTELLLHIIPRKVSMDASNCDVVTRELVAFWNFCDRVHQLESASAIASEITRLSGRFRQAMSDPANFGMAKSFFTQGQQAGFDMTTQEGMNEFMIAYNLSLAQPSTAQSRVRDHAPDWRVDAAAEQTTHVPLDCKQRKKLLVKKQKAAKRTRK